MTSIMRREIRLRRWEGLSGAIGLGFLFIALFLPGPPPKADESAASLTGTLTEHRAAFIRGTVLAGAGIVLLLWFIAKVAAAVRSADARNDSASLVIVLGGGLALTMMFVGML